MSTFYVKPEKLDKIAKPIDESKYFQWKETLMDCANQKKEWINFTSLDYKWVPRNEDKNRGLGNNEEDKKNIIPLNSYINYIAMYAPSSLVHDIINESNGNAYIDSKIRSMYQLKNNGSSVFKYFKKAKSFNHAGTSSYQDFYYELRAIKYETLYRKNQDVTIKGEKVKKDEVMSPSIENGIVIDWLSAIDGDLIEEVETQYARDLESVSLVDLQEIISQSIPTLLNKIKTKKDIGAFKIQLEKEVSVSTVNSFGRRGNRNNRGGGSFNKSKDSKRGSTNNKGGCTLCKSYGFNTRALSHELKDCYAFKNLGSKEKGMLAMTINSTLDGTELEDLNDEKPKLENNDEDDPQWYNGDSSD